MIVQVSVDSIFSRESRADPEKFLTGAYDVTGGISFIKLHNLNIFLIKICTNIKGFQFFEWGHQLNVASAPVGSTRKKKLSVSVTLLSRSWIRSLPGSIKQ